MYDKISALTEERGKTHGDFSRGGALAFDLIRRTSGSAARAPDALNFARFMICAKLARIAAGDPNFRDHWADIAGYASKAVEVIDNMTEEDRTNG